MLIRRSAQHAGIAVLVAVLSLAWWVATPPPVAAAWEANLSVVLQSNEVFGSGSGRATSDDGGIDCAWAPGSGMTGDCSEHYILASFVTELTVVLTFAAATGSWVCVFENGSCPENATTLQTSVTMQPLGSGAVRHAGFALRSYRVQGTITGGGSISSTAPTCQPASGYEYCRQFVYGETASLVAIPEPGTNFSYWNGLGCADAPRSTTCSFMVGDNAEVDAVFGQWPVTVGSDGQGKTCLVGGGMVSCVGANGSRAIWVPGYVTYEVHAEPPPGWRFDHWGSGPCHGQTGTCSFRLTADATTRAFYLEGAAPTPTPRTTPRPTATARSTPNASAAPSPSSPGTPTASAVAAAPSAGPTPIELGASADPSPATSSGGSAASQPPEASSRVRPGGDDASAPVTPSGSDQPGSIALLLGLAVVLAAALGLGGFVLGRRGRAGRDAARPPRA